MSKTIAVAPAPLTQAPLSPLSQVKRLGNIFSAPSKTFNEIAGGRCSWWMPLLVMSLFSYLMFGVLTAKIGWRQVAETTLHANARTTEQLAQAPPERRESIITMTEYSIEGSFAATPIVILLRNLVIASVLMVTVNFLFGGKASFGASFAVTMYGFLPSIVKAALGSAVAFFAAPESFNLQNFAPTSIGAFLSPTDVNPGLYKLASALDITTI